MNPSTLLYDMCHVVLSPADLKAIGKSRGFSEQEVHSRSLFENVFLSPLGVERTLHTLTDAEVAALHLLHLEQRVVDVTFFERLYGPTQAYGTFTQQFKPIFDAVQRNLIRKGVLVIGEAKTNSPTKTKMELWRYRFPAEFGPLLPPLLHPDVHGDQAGSIQTDRLRQDLGRLVQDRSAGPAHPGAMHLTASGLTVGMRPFNVQAVREWRQSAWDVDILKAESNRGALNQSYAQAGMYTGYLLPDSEYRKPNPLPAVLYAFGQLAPDAWVSAGQFDTLLDVLYAGSTHPSSATICRTGWENGCLARYQVDGTDYYRAIDSEALSSDEAPDSFLPIINGRVYVDLATVPYAALDLLNRIATFAIEDGRLRASPNVVRMVEALDAYREHEVGRYLTTHSADFRAASKKIDAQWGKLIVHENILVARVADLSLRVKLQQTFGAATGAPSAHLVFLSDEYVAFPRAMLGDIEKLLKKAGHVIKTVQAT